jgi:hypothetical protein
MVLTPPRLQRSLKAILLLLGSLLIATTTAVTARAQCTVPACISCPSDPTCSQCASGYSLISNTCFDLNECATNNAGCGTPGIGTCDNSPPGSYTCNCNSGYANAGGTSTGTCIDVNECATDACGVGSCTNGAGTFSCACPPGVTGTTCDVNGYVPPDKPTGACENAVAANVAKYVSCVLKCRKKKVTNALVDKDFDEQTCEGGPKGCREVYDKKMAQLIDNGDCPACLDAAAQGLLADDAFDHALDVKGRAYCEGTTPLAP